MPLWIGALNLEIRYFCCRDKFVNVSLDDTCNHWETQFDESIIGTSFNKD